MSDEEKMYTQMDLDRAYYSAYNQAYERAEEDRVIERI
tara:strand:+ start:1365 stop:1478 length:114 start_codon:yes stop_codon:yes gene_type:complete